MIDNFYFLYLDEIYSPNLNEFLRLTKEEIFKRNNHWHFGIAGVIVRANYLNDLNFISRRIKSRFYPKRKSTIFHYVDILNERDDFSDLHLDQDKKRSFMKSLASFVFDGDFKYSCAFIDKHELIKQYGVFDNEGRVVKIKKIGSNLFPRSPILDYNLYLLCLKKIVSSFYEFIASKRITARGIIIAEARGEREDTEIREAFHKIHCHGVGGIGPKELRSVVLDLFIVPKSQNYIGTQLADLVLYPTYDNLISDHQPRSDHFISFEKTLRRKLISNSEITLP